MQDKFFQEHVFPTEIVEIRARRQAEQLPPGQLSDRPTPENDLVGLAISGGGVRSASIALGVVQALSRRGVLRRVDYLSTVSGGGFLGSCISAMLHRPYGGTSAQDFPLNHIPGSGEPPALAHVRSYCAYLAPEGFVDTIRIPALLVRGVLINVFTAVPFLLLAVGATDFFYQNAPQAGIYLSVFAFTGMGVFMAFSLSYPVIGRLLQRSLVWSHRNLFTQMLAVSFFGALALFASIPLVGLVWLSVVTSWTSFTTHLADRVGVLMLDLESPVPWVAMGAIVLITAAVLKTVQPFREAMAKAAIYPVGLVGPALLFGAFLLMCVTTIQSPFVDGHFAESLDSVAADPTQELDSDLIQELEDRGLQLGPRPNVAKAVDGYVISGQIPIEGTQDFRAGDVASLRMMGTGWLHVSSTALVHTRQYGVGGVLVFGIFVLLLFYDVNVTSLHGFYRDRLSKAWLIAPNPNGGPPQHVDQLRLSQLREPGSRAPYHLIHAAVNTTERDLRLHGRSADFFLFSKHWIGGQLAGWCSTGVMERRDPGLDLGTAMAISGAAAAPQMGDATIRPLAILMAMLNVRMAYWLPNPGLAQDASWFTRLMMWRGASPGYLLYEALGTANSKSSHILVSDGGHIENLGIYALLSRRCKFIMAVDGEEDGGRYCASLLQVIRYARVDMGIDIEIDLSPIRLNDQGYSTRSWAVGVIHYADGHQGTLVYMKSTLTGDESAEVMNFKRRFPSFPHDSTADQFFDSERFEMYRLLGWQLAQTAIREASENPVVAPFLADVDEELTRDR